ncbi:hypothetical protein AB1Y20_016201 [Prymnesium parvum]|uniref:glutathione gamma-glutamylcysteinyltransferase n=1 Tax=Prymnesium parvum TaxID=97485 RepID=A0AB34IEK3_PRYPA
MAGRLRLRAPLAPLLSPLPALAPPPRAPRLRVRPARRRAAPMPPPLHSALSASPLPRPAPPPPRPSPLSPLSPLPPLPPLSSTPASSLAAADDEPATPEIDKHGERLTRWSFHKRELCPPLFSLSSDEGRAAFARGLAAGEHEAFFPLAEQFLTQASPPYCGLTTLAMVMNTLSIDPNERWRGGWRWFDEEILIDNCCQRAQDVRSRGISMEQFASIARCHGASVRLVRAVDVDEPSFRAAVRAAVASPRAPYLVASFCRAALGQTGDGHFSPIGGYDAATDAVLVLDVARFKYPPWYAPLPRLFAAMRTIDPATGRSRGYAAVAAAEGVGVGVGARRAVPSDGGGGGQCPVAPIRRAFCPVSPRQEELPCGGRRHASRQAVRECAGRWEEREERR